MESFSLKPNSLVFLYTFLKYVAGCGWVTGYAPCLWRQETDLRWLSQSLSLLVFESESLTNAGELCLLLDALARDLAASTPGPVVKHTESAPGVLCELWGSN